VRPAERLDPLENRRAFFIQIMLYFDPNNLLSGTQ
jgi:hypothetical protein